MLFLFLFLFTLSGYNTINAQEEVISDGSYYIANLDFYSSKIHYNSQNPQSNFYLVPSAGTMDGTPDSDPVTLFYDGQEQPYLTTFKTGPDFNSIWRIEFVETLNNKNYYRIIHVLDQKYLTHNLSKSNEANRLRVHLQSELDPDNSLFIITKNGNYYNIIPKGQTTSLNPPTGCKNYYGAPSEGGRKVTINGVTYDINGIIGLYDANDNGSKWVFETAPSNCPTPTFTYNSQEDLISISCILDNTTIYYTTDGTDPTDQSAVYSGPFELGYETQTIKAVATRQGFTQSNVATYSVTQFDTPQLSFNNTDNKLTITSDGDYIYYTTDGTEPVIGTSNTYSEPFTLLNATTVKAIAVKGGYYKSQTASKSVDKVATPVIEVDGLNTVSISTSTTGAAIYYTTNGTTPDASATRYYEPFTLNGSGITVKAVAVLDDYINSDIASVGVTLTCDVPVIRRNGMTFIIDAPQFPAQGVTVYYTTDGSTPTTSSPAYTGTAVEFGSFGITVKAMATAPGYNNSAVVSKVMMDRLDGEGTEQSPYLIMSDSDFRLFVANANQDGQDKYYKVAAHINASGSNPVTETFTGHFDGGLYTISNLFHPLFNTTNGAVVCNVILDNVSISTQANAGAICNDALGASRIYNCGVLATQSSTVSGTAYVGGLVGEIQGSSRVINCFSYADITGGTDKGGIVGYNSYASVSTDIRTMVMNCMFYGDITTGGNISPVYGGLNINNLKGGGLNTYNYYRYESDYSYNGLITEGKYNCALAVMEKHLVRFEFYRQLLNSNRRLAALYATGSAQNEQLMAKWVLEASDRGIDSPQPYPVLKKAGKYPSVINYDAENAPSLGTLQLNISTTKTDGGQSWPSGIRFRKTSMSVNRTGKDPDHYNFNYDKIQLPYYNDVATGNYTQNRVVTGWKITEITGGTAGTFTAADQWGGYNFADRDCTNKDLYSVSKRVFAQGAYYDVPNGVTAITIEPYWAAAAYATDLYYDVVYTTGYEPDTLDMLGVQFENGTAYDINGSSQTVYMSIENARAALNIPGSGATVYDYAVVLVGNVHQETPLSNSGTPYTIMSADLDCDNEPDYSFIFSHSNRQVISPIRFDFLNVPGTAMAQKPNGASQLRNVSIFKPKGWFEVTNTCIISFPQFEYEGDGKSSAPLILLGGSFDQFASTQNIEPKKTQYIHLGGNAWFKEFGNGTHSDGEKFTPHIPVSVTGGEFEKFYLSGTYRPDAEVKADNAECYVSGGRFGEMAGAALQQINGDVTWQINYAEITDFYGGGINAAKPVTGNITVDIQNSVVGTYCGGPKFGDMADGKTVTTNAAGCTFGKFFGAGYGGTSYNRVRTQDLSKYDFNKWQSDYTGKKGKYEEANGGVATDFDYDFFVWSTGVTGGRFYVKYASFSLAKTNNVSSTLNNCTITQNYYGGGNLGEVEGNVTSVLNNCHVDGNVFGAGYSATIPIVPIRNAGFTKLPKINNATGFFEDAELSGTTDYTWAEGTLTDGETGIDTQNHLIYTDVDLNNLGQVIGDVTLTINGGTITGSIYGGGDESGVSGNVQVNIVDGTITHDVYGGGALASTNTASRDLEVKTNTTVVNLTGGTIGGNVYGGGMGDADNAPIVGGNVTVYLNKDVAQDEKGCIVGGSIFGCNNFNGTPKGTVTVHIYSTQESGQPDIASKTQISDDYVYDVKAVYGGGNLAAYIPTVAATPTNVIIDGCGLSSIGYAYGGGNAAPVPATNVTIYGTYRIADVFGGGNGKDRIILNGVLTDNPGADVGIHPTDEDTYNSTPAGLRYTDANHEKGDSKYILYADTAGSIIGTTCVTVFGGKIHQLFGGSNTKGDIVKYAKVVLGHDNLSTCEFQVDSVYGGSNEAYMSGSANIDMRCITKMDQIFGGSKKADVNGNINLTITGGTYGQVFGGNNISGRIFGSITVNIEQTGCVPIIIGELYGGGNQAPYSIYGYDGYETGPDGISRPVTIDSLQEGQTPFNDPVINIISCQSIGTVYGGGYQAKMVGSPTININMVKGWTNGKYSPESDATPENDPNYGYAGTPQSATALGVIDTVFGGGNMAQVVGDTHVNIGTLQKVTVHNVSKTVYTTISTNNARPDIENPLFTVDDDPELLKDVQVTVEGVIITGNVYGGGNNADVTGSTNIQVGPNQ